MNRWTGTAHLTRDPELTTTPGGTDICVMRIAVEGAGKEFAPGYFDVKVFNAQATACASYLQTGREVAIDGRLRFEEWRTADEEPRSRVYIAADRVEFLSTRRASSDKVEEVPAAPSP